QAVSRYSILTVGDGLVSQIPALIVATASGMLVTKATTQSSLGQEISEQVTLSSRPLIVGSIIVLALAAVPGLPWFAFIPLAVALFIAGRRLAAKQARAAADPQRAASCGPTAGWPSTPAPRACPWTASRRATPPSACPPAGSPRTTASAPSWAASPWSTRPTSW